jgi:hypothetical protein
MALTPAQHQEKATIPPSKGYPRGRFPTGDVKHDRLALQFLPRAKNMSGGQKSEVRGAAMRDLAAKKALSK